MSFHNSKADRRCCRQLAEVAWERELRAEIHRLADAIREMDDGKLTPHEVNHRIYQFHDGVSRELWRRYAHSDAFFAICRAYRDGYLTDDDLADATPGVVEDIRQFVSQFLAEAPEGGEDEAESQ